MDYYAEEQFKSMIGTDDLPAELKVMYKRARHMYQAIGGASKFSAETMMIIAILAHQRDRHQKDYSDWGVGRLHVECQKRGVDTDGSRDRLRLRLIAQDDCYKKEKAVKEARG